MIDAFTLWIFIYISVVHFIADFIMQSDEMAKGKSTSIYWLTRHAISYGKIMLYGTIILGISLYYFGFNFMIFYKELLGYIFINVILHWITDYFTSKQTKRLWAEHKVHYFFIMIGLDQLIHTSCLFISLYLIFY